MNELTVQQRQYIQDRIDEMVLEGRVQIVGTTEDGQPLYRGVPGASDD